MVFARCLAVESDLFFSAASTRTSLHQRSRPSNQSTHRTSSNRRKASESESGHHTSSTASEKSGNDAASSLMPSLLSWTRKASASTSPTGTEKRVEVSSDTPNNQQESPSREQLKELSPSAQSPRKQHHPHHRHRATRRTSISHGVVFRRGDKSFLEFHQNYAIMRHLGEGSYSTVKQVTHRKRGGLFACKIVDKTALSNVDRTALSHEVKVLASVRHNHIMRLYEVIEDDSKCYLIMELAENGDLFDKIVMQGKFPEKEAQKVTAALCEALDYCHSNAIIHRDVKPENVLLSSDQHCIKLCDFGFAKQLKDPNEQSVDSCGTPGYAAPEILDGKPYGVEVDVFSLGVVTYIMICGYPPFPMKLAQLRTHRFNVRFPSKDWSHIDPAVKEMITKMLSVRPNLRPRMSELKKHPWVQAGKEILDQARAEAEARQREEALQQKQLVADTIHKKLTSTGFEVVKHGRQGHPHRTKLRLSNDGRVLSWQPKLLKRGLLKYHNAKSITSFFGFGSSKNLTKQPVTHPQVARMSSLDSARSGESGRYSEPILCDESQRNAIISSMNFTETVDAVQPSAGSQRMSKTDSANSTTSTGSANWIDKKNWWRSFRRADRAKVASTTERSASGGVSFAAFSLSSSEPAEPKTSRSLSSSSSCSAVSDSYETAADTTERSGSRISFSSEPQSPNRMSPGVSPRLNGYGQPPMSPSSTVSERVLDSSINLRDIRSVTLGEESPFFIALSGSGSCEESCCRKESVTTTAATTKTTSSTDSRFDGDEDTEENHDSKKKTSEINLWSTLTIATRYRELHLEFASEDLRDAFAFLLEQTTLPLEPSSPPQQTFLFRSPATVSELDEKPATHEQMNSSEDHSANSGNNESE